MTIAKIVFGGDAKDLGFVVLVDDNDATVFDGDGYLPAFIPEEIEVDVKTGQILNWPKITELEIVKGCLESFDTGTRKAKFLAEDYDLDLDDFE